MAYQTLYRKYRPKTFELVYGQDVIVKTLKNVIKNDKLSHAYLFTGPRGTGKTSSAKLFAKAINCLNNKDGDACNECENCKSFNNNSNPDIIEIDAASNNGVDEIREIKNKVSLVPSMSKYKVYIIDEVHMLSIGAFNALLKTLEEPPEYIIFILATTEPQKIPATIISRCQRFDFKSISHDKMKQCLENIISKENISIDDGAIEEIINNSKGGMRDAIGLLDQASAFCNNNITANDIEELSGNISIKQIRIFLSNIMQKEYNVIFDSISNYSSNGKDFALICEKIINYIREGILYKKKINTDKILDEDKNIFDKLSDTDLYDLIDYLSDTLVKVKNSYQKELTFEVQMIQMIDKIFNKESNVSRETSINKIKVENTNVPRETSINEIKAENINVPRETLKIENKTDSVIEELKNVRINNILKNATKQNITFIKDLWPNINEYLINEKYKMVAGMLVNATPVAASKKGIIITLPLESSISRIEKEYDNSKELLNEIYNENYKVVYISEQYWKKVRPKFVEKAKNGELQIIDESEVLDKLKKINDKNLVEEFNELIEMEEN
ncbi:dNA polymerase III gamma and tau subunits [Clostridium sp. CAG:594]|nr:dNA polymerase III gamma and tau subunits [Clostridium sp. CAG:594]